MYTVGRRGAEVPLPHFASVLARNMVMEAWPRTCEHRVHILAGICYVLAQQLGRQGLIVCLADPQPLHQAGPGLHN